MPIETTASLGITLRAWVIVLGTLLLGVAAVAYWRTTPTVTGRLRILLVSLRAVAFVLLAFLLLDPRSILSGKREESARVLILVDRSASMSLPAEAAGKETRFDAASRVAQAMTKQFEARGARVETLAFANHLEARADTVRPDAQGTDLAGTLAETARRYEGEHMGAVVVISDGVETESALVRPAAPGFQVWTVGVGDTLTPDDVRVAGVDYSPVVRAPSRAIVNATVGGAGPSPKRVHVSLTENGREVAASDTTLAGGNTEAVVRLPVRVEAPGRREFVLEVKVSGADAEPANNRRDVVIDAEKARARVLIVDLTPGWELSFLTGLIAKDPAFECELFTAAARPAAPVGHVRRPDQFTRSLADADAVVLASVSEEFLAQPVTEALRRFVTEKGGGLLVMPGPSSLFETAGAWGRLAPVLPLAGQPPFSFVLQYTSVGPAARAAASPVTADLVALLSQAEWQERAPLLGYYAGVAPSASAEVLVGVRGRNAPALVYATAGRGRVAAIAAGPLWRWKFVAESNGVYDELMSRLLDVLTRGEEAGRFVLAARRNVYAAGERAELFAEVFNEKLQPVTGAPVAVEVSRVAPDGTETPLARIPMHRERPDDTRLSATLDALPTGNYTVRGSAELADRTLQSKALALRVSGNSVEFQRTAQDRAELVRVARRSGGEYATVADAAGIADKIPIQARAVPTTSETVPRASTPLFLLVLLLLSAEWLLRKRAGMI